DVAESTVSLWGTEVVRRDLLSSFYESVRAGNSVAAVFQRFWSQAGCDVAVQRRSRPFHSGDFERPPSDSLWRWASVPRLHLRAECRRSELAGMYDIRCRRRRIQHCMW